MNVIIRLQNLPWSANASDIRQFFKGLQIPEGGVHIVGGENGDVFIAFSSDEDARQAMALNGGKIKDVKVTLLLSSRAEMQKVIEKARAASAYLSTKMQLPSAEAFTNQFVNKKLPETNNVKTHASQTLMANYLQHSAAAVAPMMNFQVKPNETVINHVTAAPVVTPVIPLTSGNTQLPLYYTMNNATDYINYMNMANASGNYQIDANKLRDLYNKDKRVDNNFQAMKHSQTQPEYNRYQRSSSRERQRSRSPVSSRYDDSDEKKERKRRTRFSSPEKTSSNNPLLKPQVQQIMTQPIPKPPIIAQTNLISNANVMSNTKLPNNIWDVPPPMNLNSYSSYNTNNNATVTSTRNYQTSENSSSSQYQSKSSQYTNSSSGSLSVGTCIKVANIDKETTYGDIRKFFGGFPIGNNDIKFLTDENGDHTGVALIRFVSSDSKKQSLTKNGWQLKSTQIMITSITEDDFENGFDSSRSRRDNNGGYKRSYDDPRKERYERFRERDRSDSRERERDRYPNRNNFNNNNNNNNNNRNNFQNNRFNDRFDRGGRDNYSGGRDYRNNNYNNNSNNNFNNNNNNRRDFRREYDGRNNRNFRDNEPEEKIEYIPDENFTVLIIDDIPDKNEADLFQAFPDILGITIDKYTAYCKFKTHESALAVLENRFLHYIRNKRVFVEKGSEAQYDDLVKKYGKFDNPEFIDELKNGDEIKTESEKSPSSESQEQSTSKSETDEQKKPAYESRDPRQKLQTERASSQNSNSSQNLKTDCIIIKNLDPQSKIEDVEKFFADVNIQRNQMRTHILLDKRGQPCGDCFVEFKFENDIQKAVTKNNQQLGPNRVQIMLIPREQVEAVLSSFGDDSSRQQNRPSQNRDWAPPMDFGSPGCVVMISNLCYRATIDDILDEFRDFDLKPDQIIRRYNDLGQATGNACINFNSPEDADKACEDYNKVRILNRPVWLRRL